MGVESVDRQAEENSSGGGCPVRHDGEGGSGSVSGWLGGAGGNKSSSSPSDNNENEKKVGCDSPPKYASIEEAAKHAQTPQFDQRVFLNTLRQVSSIPRVAEEKAAADTSTKGSPHHQHGDSKSHWVYPSEQQMYNAMRRKGWDNVPEDSVPLVLQIHNAVNEGTWQKITKWEGTNDIKLVRFEGRPRDLSPLAFFYSKILHYYPTPFDRHDWYVGSSKSENDNNTSASSSLLPARRPESTRYVIDYYMFDNQEDTNMPPQTYIEVRPALDGPRGFYMRGQKVLQQCFPGITMFLKRMQEPK
mmetsp:Transcript_3103/g.4191  ORF Transcript_3103/g.4191 Transcript_3103/m.4191 type:complete len:302 (+) Transcript_3103:106-1011(+)|eukprot:CAMPEP_0198138110 /NCGR_PEP_ID=MMETSP1443-20131203/1533_1 /TAXON_ID=186043 /ORGANISM="Entomoneis sp., Strain CCMP2396" /LENGTH=301 /DNA_ID=CAMNT_0043799753 /DNA_START=39 /DNA_END=944 /DNA_ORIENTATION=-